MACPDESIPFLPARPHICLKTLELIRFFPNVKGLRIITTRAGRLTPADKVVVETKTRINPWRKEFSIALTLGWNLVSHDFLDIKIFLQEAHFLALHLIFKNKIVILYKQLFFEKFSEFSILWRPFSEDWFLRCSVKVLSTLLIVKYFHFNFEIVSYFLAPYPSFFGC